MPFLPNMIPPPNTVPTPPPAIDMAKWRERSTSHDGSRPETALALDEKLENFNRVVGDYQQFHIEYGQQYAAYTGDPCARNAIAAVETLESAAALHKNFERIADDIAYEGKPFVTVPPGEHAAVSAMKAFMQSVVKKQLAEDLNKKLVRARNEIEPNLERQVAPQTPSSPGAFPSRESSISPGALPLINFPPPDLPPDSMLFAPLSVAGTTSDPGLQPAAPASQPYQTSPRRPAVEEGEVPPPPLSQGTQPMQELPHTRPEGPSDGPRSPQHRAGVAHQRPWDNVPISTPTRPTKRPRR